MLHFEIGLKPAVVNCLTNAIGPLPIALDSCSNSQTDRPVFWSALEKKFFGWGFADFFVSDVISELVFGAILTHVTWPRAQPLGQSISLKFSLETRLESEYFEPLINILAFLVQKL